MRRLVAVSLPVIAVVPVARADDALGVRARAAEDSSGPALTLDPDVVSALEDSGAPHDDSRPIVTHDSGPETTLEPVPPTMFEGLAEQRHREATTISLRGDRLVLESIESANTDRPDVGQVALDVPSRGWTARARFSHDFGFASLELTGAVSDIETRYGRGQYYDIGVQLIRRLKLSKWMTAWISLGVNARQWVGVPPPGEANAKTIMLSVGTTFR